VRVPESDSALENTFVVDITLRKLTVTDGDIAKYHAVFTAHKMNVMRRHDAISTSRAPDVTFGTAGTLVTSK
jgi:hypothetical protein